MAYIYKTTNLINGKIYIGMTIRDDNSYLGSGLKLKNAINKYGSNNFVRNILEEMSNKEKYWIEELDSTNNDIGYNISLGGTGGNHYFQTLTKDEIVLHNKKISIGRKNGKSGYTQDKAEKLAEGRTKFWDINRNNKEWLISRMKNKKRKYICIDLTIMKIYRIIGIVDFCKSNRLAKSSMVSCATNKSLHSIYSGWLCIHDNNETDNEIYEKVSLLKKRYNEEKEQGRKRISDFAKTRVGAKNPNAKIIKFQNDQGKIVIFNGNFEKDCKTLTGQSVDIMRKLKQGKINEHKGWFFVNG